MDALPLERSDHIKLRGKAAGQSEGRLLVLLWQPVLLLRCLHPGARLKLVGNLHN